MCSDDHGVCVWEWHQFDVCSGEGYWHMGPFDSGDWAFDYYMVNLSVVLSFLSFVSEIYVGGSADFVDGSKCWETVILVGRHRLLCGLG
jgi:hypothetical protein